MDRKPSPLVQPRKEKHPDRSTLTVDGTWDIETEAWDTFVAGCLYLPGQYTRTYSWREEEAFVDALLSLGDQTIWAHNGGKFDTLWLLKHVARRGITDFKIALSGPAIACLEVGRTKFRDSMRIVPMSLAKASALGNVRKVEVGLPCRCGAECGGYCSITRRMPAAEERQMREYMVTDCRALYAVLDALCAYAERNDLDLKPTIGASAWATAERLGVPKADWTGGRTTSMALYRKVRTAYYGGRTQVLKPQSPRGWHYDIHSAYPAAFEKLELGLGERSEIEGDAAARAYAAGRFGVFRAVVHVPECFLPPLPVRTRFRSAYPIGRFGGWWTGLELQSAQSRGTVIERIDEGVVWSDRALVLAPLARRVWELRDAASAQGNQAWKGWTKLFINSLSGKLSMRPESETIVGADQARFCDAPHVCYGYCEGNKCCEHRCSGYCGQTPPLGSAELGLFRRRTYHLARCSQVHWAAHVTAHARTQILAMGGDDSVYCDTDSMFCERERHGSRLGADLGQWGLEDVYRDFEAIAPKTYQYWDESTGAVVAASKGVPDAARNFGRLAEGVTVDRGVLSFKAAVAAGDLFKRKKLTRRVMGDGKHFGDRLLGPDGRTRAQTVRQVDAYYYELLDGE